MELFDPIMGPFGGGQVLSRWGHVLAGITWIGLLYFFNFVQVPAYAELTDPARSEAIRKVTLRALWWFRWAAALTFLTGLMILSFQEVLGSNFTSYFTTSQGTSIAFGSIIATIMFLNVWLVIWPNQKIVIGNAETVASGGEPNPDAPASGKKAVRASRCNAMLSIPMLWFMVFTSHYATNFPADAGRDRLGAAWTVFIILVGISELTALGLVGGYDSAGAKAMFDDHRKTIAWGFIMWAMLYIGCFEIVLNGKVL